MKVIIPSGVMERIRLYVEECSTEIAWQGLISPKYDKTGKHLEGARVDEVFLPKQEVGAASVDHKDEDQFGYMDFLREAGRENDISRIGYHGHSHVNMGVSPSNTDTDFYYEATVGTFPQQAKIFVSTIHNKKGELSALVHAWAPGLGYVKFNGTVEVEAEESFLRRAVKAEIGEKVTPKTYVYQGGSGPHGADRYWEGWEWDSETRTRVWRGTSSKKEETPKPQETQTQQATKQLVDVAPREVRMPEPPPGSIFHAVNFRTLELEDVGKLTDEDLMELVSLHELDDSLGSDDSYLVYNEALRELDTRGVDAALTHYLKLRYDKYIELNKHLLTQKPVKAQEA